jgi:hypothetical protein
MDEATRKRKEAYFNRQRYEKPFYKLFRSQYEKNYGAAISLSKTDIYGKLTRTDILFIIDTNTFKNRYNDLKKLLDTTSWEQLEQQENATN